MCSEREFCFISLSVCVCVCIKGIPPPPPPILRRDSSVDRASDCRKSQVQYCRGYDSQVRRQGIFSQGQLSVQTLLHGLRRGVQSHVSTSVLTLEIPETGSRTIVWTHKNTAHTPVGMGSAALAAALPYPDKSTRISRKGQ